MESRHSETHTSDAQHRGASRRAVVTTAAWSAPVIAAAIATPLAAASTNDTVEFLRLSGYTYMQKFFNTALDTRYEVYPGVGFQIVNNTSATIAAGEITATVSVDANVYRLSDGETVSLSVNGTDFTTVAAVASGVATMSFTVPAEVAASVSTDVYVNLPFYNSAPDDVYDVYSPAVITVTYAGETTTIGPFTAEAFPSTPWWVDYTIDFDTLTDVVAGSCTTGVPSSGTVESKGPNPSPADLQLVLRVDAGLISDVQTTARLDGAPFSGTFVQDLGDANLWFFDIDQEFASGQILTVDLSYTPVDGATSATITPSSSVGTPALYDSANVSYTLAADQRVGVSGFYGSPPVCTV